MLAEQISIFIENKEGRLAEVTAILRDADVNIRACLWRIPRISGSCASL